MNIQIAYKIHIKGLVQGVGFRPFIYRLATEQRLTGWVENRNDGVMIKVQAEQDQVERFISLLRARAPAASSIRSIQLMKSQKEDLEGFYIHRSNDHSGQITEISPDIAVCNDCLEDMKFQSHRIHYPFINCTNCGPRFSIIKDLPYDRPNTTMHRFRMCKECYEEYTDVNNRRFHAQPVACNHCGPEYEYYQHGRIIRQTERIFSEMKKLLYKGGIIGIKGIGGFHLMCDARLDRTVRRLRMLKSRDQKPFACMFPDVDTIRRYARVNEAEEKSLTSWRRPIVLLKEHTGLSQSLNDGLDTLGAMLPYMPLHYMLFEEIDLPAVVMTSGNISDEPLIMDNETAYSRLSGLVDAFLFHNREIYNRVDDSVVRIIDGGECLIRRARGYIPEPLDMGLDVDGIFATGAELKNCFCVGKGNQAIMSQHTGDLKNYEAYNFFTQAARQFMHLFRVDPGFVVSDMHPDYLSTKYARNFVAQKAVNKQGQRNDKIQWLQVQHHHAHIASCMAENQLDEKVLGIALDGTGYGEDGKIWGGEFLICDLSEYSRYAHFDYVPMPGGEKAVKEPWRMALSYLYQAFGEKLHQHEFAFLENKKPEDVKLILSMIRKGIKSPHTSSAGRLFDAVSALLNLCTESGFEAEAPMKLESIIDPQIEGYYDFESGGKGIGFVPVFRQIVEDMEQGESGPVMAAKFHNTVAKIITTTAREVRESYDIRKVVLSGGTFQNKYLSEVTTQWLRNLNFEVYRNKLVPSNDGGIALGQLAIAAQKRR
ncbi:MAG: carbamoyltransferase HypF [Bacteroidales bacterium]